MRVLLVHVGWNDVDLGSVMGKFSSLIVPGSPATAGPGIKVGAPRGAGTPPDSAGDRHRFFIYRRVPLAPRPEEPLMQQEYVRAQLMPPYEEVDGVPLIAAAMTRLEINAVVIVQNLSEVSSTESYYPFVGAFARFPYAGEHSLLVVYKHDEFNQERSVMASIQKAPRQAGGAGTTSRSLTTFQDNVALDGRIPKKFTTPGACVVNTQGLVSSGIQNNTHAGTALEKLVAPAPDGSEVILFGVAQERPGDTPEVIVNGRGFEWSDVPLEKACADAGVTEALRLQLGTALGGADPVELAVELHLGSIWRGFWNDKVAVPGRDAAVAVISHLCSTVSGYRGVIAAGAESFLPEFNWGLFFPSLGHSLITYSLFRSMCHWSAPHCGKAVIGREDRFSNPTIEHAALAAGKDMWGPRASGEDDWQVCSAHRMLISTLQALVATRAGAAGPAGARLRGIYNNIGDIYLTTASQWINDATRSSQLLTFDQPDDGSPPLLFQHYTALMNLCAASEGQEQAFRPHGGGTDSSGPRTSSGAGFLNGVLSSPENLTTNGVLVAPEFYRVIAIFNLALSRVLRENGDPEATLRRILLVYKIGLGTWSLEEDQIRRFFETTEEQ